MKKLFTLILAIILIVYPVGIYFGWKYDFDKRIIAGGLCGLFLLRAFLLKDAGAQLLRQLLPICVIVVMTSVLVIFSDDDFYLLFNPALIGLVFLGCFAYTLYKPPTMIARLAALQIPHLPEVAIAYCRKVTIVWCLFFFANACISLGTVAYAVIHEDRAVWALYNGLISYVLMGLLFAVEYGIRRMKIKHFDEEIVREKAIKEVGDQA